jgi:hypothetical protein
MSESTEEPVSNKIVIDSDDEWTRSSALKYSIDYFEKLGGCSVVDEDSVVLVADKFFKFLKGV